jgi:hypothetical protein
VSVQKRWLTVIGRANHLGRLDLFRLRKLGDSLSCSAVNSFSGHAPPLAWVAGEDDLIAQRSAFFA